MADDTNMHKIGVSHGARVKFMRANGGPSRGWLAMLFFRLCLLIAGPKKFLSVLGNIHVRLVPPFGRTGKLAENLKTTFSTKTPLLKKTANWEVTAETALKSKQ